MRCELLIFGTAGLAKEFAQLARRIDPVESRWSTIAYVTNELAERGRALPFGSIRYSDHDISHLIEHADALIGVGYPALRRNIVERLMQYKTLDYPNLLHPALDIDRNLVHFGKGNTVTQGVVMTCDIAIGDFNHINLNTTVGHDTRIGSFNVINPGSNISGGVTIGDECLIGTGASILEGLSIASGTQIGAGAVVTKSIDEPGIYIGVPARPMKK